ncbi:MAG: peptide deformylase [Coriobacteriales bacterium]
MELPDIVIAPDERLNTECAKVEAIDEEVKRIAKGMAKAMYKNMGCGLAAPQIGVLRQIVVIDVDWDGEKSSTRNTLYLINPQIIDKSEETETGEEGCLSIPGVSFPIERSTSVVVRAYDLQGRLMQYEASHNLLAVCLQHEIDHLHGITMFERLSPEQRLVAVQEYQQALAAGARPGDTEVQA